MTEETRRKRRASLRRARLSALRSSVWYDLWPWVGLAVGVAGGLALLGSVSSASPLYKFHVATFDNLLKRRPVEVLDGPGSPVAVVGIDEATLGKLGSPIPRGELSRGLDNLLKAEPKGIVLDIQFTTPDRTTARVSEALRAAETKLSAKPQALAPIEERFDETSQLVKTLSDPRIIGTFYAHGHIGDETVPLGDAEEEQLALVETPIDDDGGSCGRFPGAAGIILDRPEFLDAYKAHGNARLEPEADGLLRRYRLFIRYGDQLYPSLAIAAAAVASSEDPDFRLVQIECDEDGVLLGFSIGASTPFAAKDYSDGRIWINFGGSFKESFPQWTSFLDLAVDPTEAELAKLREKFKDKLVFVGPRSDYEDKYPTFDDVVFPGVAAHATVAHALLEKRWLHRSTYVALLWEPLACILIGLLVSLLFIKFESTWLIALAPASPAIGMWFSVEMLERGLLVDGLFPGLVGTAAVLGCGALRFIVEQQKAEQERRRAELESVRAEKEKVRAEEEALRAERLGAFLSPEVAKIAGENPDLLKPQRQEISILFSDIRSFTTMTEGMEPEDLAIMLSEYLTWMTAIVLSNKGTLDKYIGDAVMAIFGAPLREEAHARWACATALEMMDALDSLNERWTEQGRKTLAIGIGINSGSVVVGTMGSKNKPEYTCIGDEVNFASRAEGLTKAYGATIIVGEPTMKLAGGDFLFRDLGPVKVKGKTKGVKIYELVGTKASMPDAQVWIDVFHQGLNAFFLRDWDKAEELFERVRSMRNGNDGPAKAYLVWTKSFRVHPPDEAWDGTLERAEK